MSDDDDRPTFTVVAENDDRAIAKQRALDDLRWPTREMAANLLRVMRGAGNPHYLPQHILNLAYAIEQAGEHSNAWGIWNVMEDVLHDALPDWETSTDVEGAEHTIIRGSLQMAASKLVYQNAQQAAGSREIREGIREIERIVERLREKHAQEWAARQPRPKPRIVRKPRAKKPAKVPTPKATPKLQPEVEEGRKLSTVEAMRIRKRELADQR